MFAEKVFKLMPAFVQEVLISIKNYSAFRVRHGSEYLKAIEYYHDKRFISRKENDKIQNELLHKFVRYAAYNTIYYKEKLAGVDLSKLSKDNMDVLPILEKETLRSEIDSIYSDEKHTSEARTGGTTGKPLVVKYSVNDVKWRNGKLDEFRSRFGYKFGKRTAWLSGKHIIFDKDVKRNKFWKTDRLHKIRYYSTFHITKDTVPYILANLNEYAPEFIVGFPSSMVEIVNIAKRLNLSTSFNVKAIFPTAETIVPDDKEALESFFKTGVYNQYASSEGAPFITECEERRLHLEPLTGVFEVLDEHMNPVNEGELVVTAFHTHGTPLIRYRIGDRVSLSDKICTCGRETQVVSAILGRINDFILSEERGKINLGNISNCLKYVKGVVRFQIEQNEINLIVVRVVKDSTYTLNDEKLFRQELRNRVGLNMQINFEYLDKIPLEQSGKYRLIKNNVVLDNKS